MGIMRMEVTQIQTEAIVMERTLIPMDIIRVSMVIQLMGRTTTAMASVDIMKRTPLTSVGRRKTLT